MTKYRVYEPIWIVRCDGCGAVVTGLAADYADGMDYAVSVNEAEDATRAAAAAGWQSAGAIDLCADCQRRLREMGAAS
ncbi:MAG: hypothetical protein M5U09_22770 [Gammaproteobacteria bacterium]|nr:hypothetical protein [Gammaproteobacteria bacterium]